MPDQAPDKELARRVRGELGPFELVGLKVSARRGVVYLRGVVATDDQRQKAEWLARGVEGARGVVNEVAVEPLSVERMPHKREIEPLVEADQELEGAEAVPGTEVHFNLPVGTTDPAEAAEEAEPFYPSTDPIVRVVPREKQGIEITGGFSRGALDRPIESEDHPARLQRNDEELAEEVRLALREDAATSDLLVWVVVRDRVVHLRGRVSSLDEAEQAEEVAGRVFGVQEVREELEVEGI